VSFALTPVRTHEAEILDDPRVPAPVRRRSHRDIALSNTLFGGTRALLLELDDVLPALGPAATFLDIGAGTGETAAHVRVRGARRGVRIDTVALDADAGLTDASRRHADHAVCATALALPFADRSVDVVACTQVLHHFDGDALLTLLAEMHRVARHRVIVCDLRRSRLAVAGLWLASFALRFHPVSRHDGMLSIRRGFTARELAASVREAVGQEPRVRRRWSFRLAMSWNPLAAGGASPRRGGVPAVGASR
jgi:SAM-dependent methyltransferase